MKKELKMHKHKEVDKEYESDKIENDEFFQMKIVHNLKKINNIRP
jgi:hypothetical protein